MIALTGLPEISEGDDLARVLAGSMDTGILDDDDVLVIAQKVVSKAEGRIAAAADRRSAAEAESRRVLRRSGDMIISETHHGFVCANAGVDASNVATDTIALLPLDPDLSARRIRAGLKHITGKDVGVIVSDTFGRAWRLGQTNVAIGVAGIDPFVDYRGMVDSYGNELSATRICIADELAGAAEMAMGKSTGICAVLIKGAPVDRTAGDARSIARPPEEDLFR